MNFHRPSNRWSDIPPNRQPEAKAAMCDGKDALSPGQARRIAKRMRSQRKTVEAYRCLRCGQWHVGKKIGR